MSQAELVSIIGVLFGLLFGLVAVIYSIIRSDVAKLYESRHEDAQKFAAMNAVLWPLAEKVANIEEDQAGLREWKHLVIDPYVPRAIDEHERRMNRLDAKVFNGGIK